MSSVPTALHATLRPQQGERKGHATRREAVCTMLQCMAEVATVNRRTETVTKGIW